MTKRTWIIIAAILMAPVSLFLIFCAGLALYQSIIGLTLIDYVLGVPMLMFVIGFCILVFIYET